MFKYSDEAAKAIDILNQYDLTDRLAKCREDGYDSVEGAKSYLIVMLIDFIDIVRALHTLTEAEFMRYTSDKYGVKWCKIISYKMW